MPATATRAPAPPVPDHSALEIYCAVEAISLGMLQLFTPLGEEERLTLELASMLVEAEELSARELFELLCEEWGPPSPLRADRVREALHRRVREGSDGQTPAAA